MIFAMSLALLGTSAAPDQAAASAATAPAARPVKEKKICIVDPATTGSLMRSKICKTKAQWDALAARDQGTADNRNSSAQPTAGNGN